jgi:hypothetical protein
MISYLRTSMDENIFPMVPFPVMSWRTTMSPPETSTDGSVVGAGVGTSDGFYWERVLASFIANSSAALAHPYFYLIRTTTQWSLCQLSGLSPINYITHQL